MKPVYLTMEEIAVLKSMVSMALPASKSDRRMIDKLHRKLFAALIESEENSNE